jgi:short-subunit dehydrogenase
VIGGIARFDRSRPPGTPGGARSHILRAVGETALVTGASSGLGEQFARQLSARGYDVILVARRKDRLEALAEELPTSAYAIQCDLANEADKLPGKVRQRRLDVDLLVNNAGFGNHARFLDIDPGSDAEMVRVNCEAVVVLTRAFLPAMVERGGGGVITVASTAGFQPLPYEATYSATKAFAKTFMDALHIELRGTGVKSLNVNPGPVPTEWQEIANIPEESIPPGAISAEQCVAQALKAYERGKRSVVPGFVIRQVMRFSAPAPRAVQLRVAERMYRPPQD